MTYKEKIEELTQLKDYRLLYVFYSGSKLYGTDSETSDVDYKGVYVAKEDILCLKKDLEHFTYSSGSDETKNGSEDIDIQLYSLHMFFDLLRKGETSAIEIVFSVFREDNIIFIDDEFKKFIKENYKLLVSKKLDSFFGYCLGQTKKYGVKGERLTELTKIIAFFKTINEKESKLQRFKSSIEENIFNFNYQFIRFDSQLDGSKNNNVEYLEILGRKFLLTNSVEYTIQRLQEVEKDYGERAKRAKEGIDYKAISHAYRIVSQVRELVTDGKITFPRPNAEEIKRIKYGKLSYEEYQSLLETIGAEIDELSALVLESDLLPETVSEETLDKYTLMFVKNKRSVLSSFKQKLVILLDKLKGE